MTSAYEQVIALLDFRKGKITANEYFKRASLAERLCAQQEVEELKKVHGAIFYEPVERKST